MLIDIKTPYGSNKFDLGVDEVTALIRRAYEFAEGRKGEADTHLKIEELKGIQEAVADAWGVVARKEAEKVEEREKCVETENTASGQHQKKSRNDSLFGEGWRDEVQEKTLENEQRDYVKYTDGYTGFLYIKCPECGAVKGFCAKKQTKIHICKECGEKTELEDLKPMYVHCECGKDSKYYTNMDEECFKCKCIDCGDEVDIQINTRNTAYVTKRKYGTDYGRSLGKGARTSYDREY